MRNFNAFVAVILDLNVNLLFKKYDKQSEDAIKVKEGMQLFIDYFNYLWI